jgi:hypothetical protein
MRMLVSALCAVSLAAVLLSTVKGQPPYSDLGDVGDVPITPWTDDEAGIEITDRDSMGHYPMEEGPYPGCNCSDAEGMGCETCDQAACSCCARCRPRWNASAEAMILRRDNGNWDQPIVLDAQSQTLLSAGSLDFDLETGMRFWLGRSIKGCYAVEGGYFRVDDWTATAAVTGDNNLRLPGDLALASFDYLDADQMRLDYSSEIQNAEINLVRTGRVADLLFGFRYLELDEDLNIEAVDAGRTSDYSISARNSLYGGQIGVRASRSYKRVRAKIICKAGLYETDSRQDTFIGDFNNTITLRNVQASQGNLAFVGEVGLNLAVCISHGWRVVGGYNVMWIEGIALAPNQLDFTDTVTSSQFVDTDGGVFLHGANAGIERRW